MSSYESVRDTLEPQVIAVRLVVDDYGSLNFVDTVRLTCASCGLVVERPQRVRWFSNPPLARHCSPACAKREFERRRRGRRPQLAVSRPRRRAVFERDGWACRTCGSRDDLTIDHIMPKAKGGTSAFDNLQTLCFACNQQKADIT